MKYVRLILLCVILSGCKTMDMTGYTFSKIQNDDPTKEAEYEQVPAFRVVGAGPGMFGWKRTIDGEKTTEEVTADARAPGMLQRIGESVGTGLTRRNN